jgi:hypothetical protein
MTELRGAVIGYGLAGSLFDAPLIAATLDAARRSAATGTVVSLR